LFPFINLANSITVARILVLYAAVTLVYAQSMSSLIVAVALSIVIIMMDALDGYVARRRNEVTQFGGVLDITGDRIVENVFLDRVRRSRRDSGLDPDHRHVAWIFHRRDPQSGALGRQNRIR
jgi:hypothetical protein